MRSVPRYSELHVHSSYSFLDGASSPAELVHRADELGLESLALTDHNGFPGVVQLSSAVRSIGLPVSIGTELTLTPSPRAGVPDPKGEHVLLIARSSHGYSRLSRVIGQAMLASGSKASASYSLESLGSESRGEWLVLSGCRKGVVRRALEGAFPNDPKRWDIEASQREVERLASLFGRDNVAVELTNTGNPLDRMRCMALADIADAVGVPYVATGNVHYAYPEDRALADILAATRANTT